MLCWWKFLVEEVFYIIDKGKEIWRRRKKEENREGGERKGRRGDGVWVVIGIRFRI